MDRTVLDWLLEDKNPEVKLRTLKEYEHYPENGRYVLTASKSVPAFKVGNVGEENKWVTLYACMAQE